MYLYVFMCFSHVFTSFRFLEIYTSRMQKYEYRSIYLLYYSGIMDVGAMYIPLAFLQIYTYSNVFSCSRCKFPVQRCQIKYCTST
jgi:hypothetical protein